MLIPERLVRLMADRQISQSELARRVRVSQQTIGKLCKGASASSAHLHKIARELDTTAEYLTGETNDPESALPDDHLSSDERDWIDLLRDLDAKDRAAILQITRSLARDDKGPTLHSPASDYRAG